MKMIDAIVYASSTGHTRRYAEMLSDILNIPAVTTRTAFTKLPKGSNILFMGWIRARDYMGYDMFLKKHNVRAACAVGAVESGEDQLKYLRKKNRIDESIPMFYLRGGFDIEKTKGADRQMKEALIEKLSKKHTKCKNSSAQLTPAEKELLGTLLYGGDYVEEDRLADIIGWYNSLK